MTDLTKIEKPFGLLDDETKRSLLDAQEAVATIQQYAFGGWVDAGGFYEAYTYRIKPERPDNS